MKTKNKAKNTMGPPTNGNSKLDQRPRTRSTCEHSEPKPSDSVACTKPSTSTSKPILHSVSELPSSQNNPEFSARISGPKVSKARKALYFGYEDEDASLINSDSCNSLHSLLKYPTLKMETNDFESSIPPWTSPPPPSVPVAEDTQPGARRSQRLILKHETCPESREFKQNSRDVHVVDRISVHSDYGTGSENSFTMRASERRGRKRNDSILVYTLANHSKKRKVGIGVQSDTDGNIESQGYGSNTEAEDNLSNLSLYEFENETRCNTHLLESDNDQVTIEKKRKVEEWDCVMATADEDSLLFSSQPYLNIGNLRSVEETHVKLVTHRGIHCLIPLEGYKLPPRTFDLIPEIGSRLDRRKSRLMGPSHEFCPFLIKTFNNFEVEADLRKRGLRIISASPVVSLEPRGTTFCEMYPVIVSIPLEVYPSPGDEIYCLYSQTSNEVDGEDFKWFVHRNVNITIDEDHTPAVTFETFEFCLFTIVIREQHLMATKQIRSRIGGRLVVPDSMIEINFPKGSVPEDIIAKVRVHLDTELSLPDVLLHDGFKGVCLASPILLLEPHGTDFSPECVIIQLPIPDYDVIMQRFGSQARLTIWESRTDENEIPDWKLLDVNFTVSRVKHTTVICFKVSHFSFFRAVWDLISQSLYDAKVGVSYFYPFISFAMKCQANMEENSERNSFGLEVICYKSDKMLPLPELTNYVHRVGACSKPKLVKPGKIIVRLKSLFFEADLDAGEDPNLEKEEADFRGRDFEMQYACKFKPDISIDRGTFGKVIVKRFLKTGKEEALFEFNLQKSGHEGESTPQDRSDRWSIVALKELATNLFITDGDNWKIFAAQIGFTKREVKLNLKNAPDPFISMIHMYQQRGGTPDEFVKVLYSVHRELKINGGASPSSNTSRSSNTSSGLGSLPGKNFVGSDSSDTSGTQISQDSLLSKTRKRSNTSINRSKDSGSNDKKRRKISKFSETLASRRINGERSSSENRSTGTDSEEELLNRKATSIAVSDNTSLNHRNDQTPLMPSFLWEISSFMDTLNWRALGRSLGVEEAVLLNIEHAYKSSGFRECSYQMLLHWKEKYPKKCTFSTLYCALRKENMNAIAKKMKFVRSND